MQIRHYLPEPIKEKIQSTDAVWSIEMEKRALLQKEQKQWGGEKKWHNRGEEVNKRERWDVWSEIETKMRKADKQIWAVWLNFYGKYNDG